jgi:hypothetical protein
MTGGDRYRKLPGRRRGLFKGASLWLGSDHLLSVKSLRIREEYKRFHFRDVQAIVVARAPRFHVSTPDLLAALLWLAAYLFAVNLRPHTTWILWSLAAALLLAWVLISARWSCRCRIYTAVSREELPSIDRIWTARKFLDQVTPRIAEVQGALPDGWAESAAALSPGPSAPSAIVPPGMDVLHPDARIHTVAADIFVCTLWANALANLLVLRSDTPAASWTQILFGLALLAETVILFVEYHRGLLRRPMQRLAIANLIAVGAMYYVRQVIFSLSAAVKQPNADLRIPTFYAGDALTRGIGAGVCLILGLVGTGIIFLRKRPQ